MMGEYGIRLKKWVIKVIKHERSQEWRDSTVDARSKTQNIDHGLSWVCTGQLCEHIIGADHIPRSTTLAIRSTSGPLHERSTTERSTTRVSAVYYMMQEVNYIAGDT